MNFSVRYLLALAAIILFIIAAILGFTWFGTSSNTGDILGVISLGLACFAGALVAP